MYAEDAQLFISFVTSEFSATILHLQATVDLVSQWMSANLLSLNQSKTEFLLIGLPAQLFPVFVDSRVAEWLKLSPATLEVTGSLDYLVWFQ